MSFPSFKELKNLNDKQIMDELILIKKELFTLRLKKATRQSIKPHFFKLNKRKLAQLLTLRSERNLTT